MKLRSLLVNVAVILTPGMLGDAGPRCGSRPERPLPAPDTSSPGDKDARAPGAEIVVAYSTR